jgi:2-furoyl-CoA dehydrogenase FAD binding subunit
MKPAPFDYVRAENSAEAVGHLAERGDKARILAGGQSLLALMNMRMIAPELLIDISRAKDLTGIERKDNWIEINAAVTQSQLERWPDLAKTVPLVAKALPHIGHFQTRNKGTVCGSIAYADPSSELPLCLSVLNGQVIVAKPRRNRVVRGRDFFTGPLQTARFADELIAGIRLPIAQPDQAFAFKEMAVRHGDFAIIAAAVRVTPNIITIGIGGSAERPEVRDLPMLQGSALDDALNMFAWELPMQDDAHADARYRRHLVRTLGRAAIEEACACLS